MPPPLLMSKFLECKEPGIILPKKFTTVFIQLPLSLKPSALSRISTDGKTIKVNNQNYDIQRNSNATTSLINGNLETIEEHWIMKKVISVPQIDYTKLLNEGIKKAKQQPYAQISSIEPASHSKKKKKLSTS